MVFFWAVVSYATYTKHKSPGPVSDLDLTFLPGLDLCTHLQLGFPGVLTLCPALLSELTFLPLFRGDA